MTVQVIPINVGVKMNTHTMTQIFQGALDAAKHVEETNGPTRMLLMDIETAASLAGMIRLHPDETVKAFLLNELGQISVVEKENLEEVKE